MRSLHGSSSDLMVRCVARMPASCANRPAFCRCTNGFIELNPCTPYTGQAGRTSTGTLKFEHVFQQKLQIDDFAQCVIDNKESIVKCEDGWRDMLIIDANYRSIKFGKKEKIG